MNNFCLAATATTKFHSSSVVLFSLACFVDVKTYSRKYTSFQDTFGIVKEIYTVGESTGLLIVSAMTARKMELPTVAARKSKGYYWNRQMHFACLTLVLMMAAFAALYCGVYFGLKDDRGITLRTY